MEKVTDNNYKFKKNSNNAYLIAADINILIDGVGEDAVCGRPRPEVGRPARGGRETDPGKDGSDPTKAR